MIYNLGQIAAFPFCGLLADGFGRKTCVFVGCLILLIGTAVQGSCHTLNVFMGGPFILGFGAALASAAGLAYTVELAPPHYRGTMAGLFNTFWWLGNISRHYRPEHRW
jgi:MFS family permease